MANKQQFDCINFDERFSEHVTQWMGQHQHKYGNDTDRMEAQMPEVYLRWINMPANWLGGRAPALYFTQFDDADDLVRWMCAYFEQKVPVPDPLLERIVELGDPAEQRLDALLRDPNAPYEAVLTAMSLLRELCSALPMALYVHTIAACPQANEQVDMAAEALLGMGPAVAPEILAVLPAATEAAETIFLDVLCNFPGDERIYDLALRKFIAAQDNRALYASYLGKLGDPRAIPALLAAAESTETNYLDFIEINNAIDELGGDALPERDFTGDPYYESLKRVRG
ncbi:MAG: hypothetical protein FWD25_01610 [Clostridia bacterium]|nr:hypothetical protein [Clostridia bacterium]